MTRIRTGNLRRKRRPVISRCPVHGKPYRGNGWVYAAGYSFAMMECPVRHCHHFELVAPAQRNVTLNLDIF